jgi:hypothetical protein
MEDVEGAPSAPAPPLRSGPNTSDPSPSSSPPPESAGSLPAAATTLLVEVLIEKLRQKPTPLAAAAHITMHLSAGTQAANGNTETRLLKSSAEFKTLSDAAEVSKAGGDFPLVPPPSPYPDPFAARSVSGEGKAGKDNALDALQKGAVDVSNTYDAVCLPPAPPLDPKKPRVEALLIALPTTDLTTAISSSALDHNIKTRIVTFLAQPPSTLKPLAFFTAFLIVFATLQCRMVGVAAALAIPAYWLSIGGLLFTGAAATVRVGQLFFLGHFPVQFNPATSFGFLFGPDEVKRGREKHANTARHWGFKEGLSTFLCRTGWIYSVLLSCMPPILCANTNFIDIHSASAAANAFSTAGITSRWESTFALTLIILFFQAMRARYVNVVSARVGRFLLPALHRMGRVFPFKTTVTIGGVGWGFPSCKRVVPWCVFLAGSYTCVFVMGWHFCTISDVAMLKNVLANYVVWRELVKFPLLAEELKALLKQLWPLVRLRGELLSKDEQLAHPHFTSAFALLSTHARGKVLEYIAQAVLPFDALRRAKLSFSTYTCGVTLQQAAGETFDEFHCRAESFTAERNEARVEGGGMEDWEIRVRVVYAGEGKLSFAFVYPVALF